LKLAPEPPAWVSEVPVVGSKVTALWHRAATDMEGVAAGLRPQIGSAARWLLAKGAGMGLAALELLLVLLISALLYGSGEILAGYVRSFAERLGGHRSLHSLSIAIQTIRGVSLGIIGTAAIQGALSAIGFWLADVPGWVLLSCIGFVSALLQIGTGLVWLPVAAWLFYQDAHGWAAFTVIWGIFINTIDNFIKPYLISQGSGLPLALIFMGVLGGLLTWGFIGIFLGPTLLATGYTLLKSWLEQTSAESAAPGAVASEQ
jgi:predicted PurR-regulated permease PerM